MQGPLDHSGNLNPLDKQNPLEDPLLDALEHDTENLPGFVDPLAEQDGQLTDGLSKQLDAIEANIENSTFPNPPEPDVGDDIDEPDTEGGVTTIPNESLLPDDRESIDATDDLSGTFDNPLPDLPHVQPDSTGDRRQMPGPSHRRGSGSSGMGGPRFRGGIRGRSRHIKAGIVRTRRYCPDSRNLVKEEQCQSCEKYRRWPEGTDEEPKECWYDWQAKLSIEGSNHTDNEEY